MQKELTIGVLGFGTLGALAVEAIIRSTERPNLVRVVERASNRAEIARMRVVPVTAKTVGRVDVLIVAVKPDQFEDAWNGIVLEGDPVILSFMARTSLATVERVTGSKRVARLMTTTACVLGKGVGAWMPGADLDVGGRALVAGLVAILGTHLQAERESEFAVATALSSMNGMVFLLFQYFAEALLYIGAPKRYLALIVPLVESACAYRAYRASTHPVALADEVTSSGGTTIQLRYHLSRASVDAAIMDAVKAAADRAKE